MPRLERLEDRIAPAASSLAQWNNAGSWVTGDLGKGSVLEGDSIAYRDAMTGLTVGNNYTLTITWQTTTNNGAHALDYLTSYDYTWNGGSGSGTSVVGHALDDTGLDPLTTPSTTFQIPTDPNINSGPASNFMIPGRTPVGSPGNPPDQFFTEFGGTLTGVSGYQIYPLTGGGGGTFQTLTISFTADISNPVFLWGGHVASQLDWGPGLGAGSTSGNVTTKQVSLIDQSNGQTIDTSAQSRTFMASNVTVPTIIVVNKQVPSGQESSTPFGFTTTPGVFVTPPDRPPNFTNAFELDGSNTVPPNTLPASSGDNAWILQTTATGPQNIMEDLSTLPEGWTLTSITGATSTNLSTGTATINATNGAVFFITFTDSFQGSSSIATVIQDAATGTPLPPQSPSPGSAAVGESGTSVFDTATMDFNPAEGPPPTGDVTYTFTGSELAALTPPMGWTRDPNDPTNRTWTETVSLNADGTVPNSAATGPLPPGTDYVFTAAYGGDSNYTGSSSDDEPLTISQGPSTTTTEIMAAPGSSLTGTGSPAIGQLGTSVFDTATVTSPDGTPTGSVTFTFTGAALATLTPPTGWNAATPGAMTWTSDPVELNANGMADSPATGPLPAGTDYSFTAAFTSANGDFMGSSSTPEALTINPGTSTITSEPLDASGGQLTGMLNESVIDRVMVSGDPAAFPPTGTVIFTFTGAGLATLTPPTGWNAATPGAMTWTSDPVKLNANGMADSPATGPLPAGTDYQFTASYSGDNNYSSSTDAPEPLKIGPGNSNLSTNIMAAPGSSLDNGQAPLGTSVFDTATLTAPVTRSGATGVTPTGNVTYTFTGSELATLTPPPGSGWIVSNGGMTWTFTVPVTSSGPVTPTPNTPPLPAGSYDFQAEYSGDNNFNGSTSALEPFTINKGNPTTATVIMAAPGSSLTGPSTLPIGVLGTSVFDTATVTGSPAAFTPTGKVTYTLTGAALATLTVPAGWDQAGQTGLRTWTETVTLMNGMAASPATPALPAGSYLFQASYSGDPNYQPSTSRFEPLTIRPGRSTTATTIKGPPTGTAGESVFDTAMVTGTLPEFTPTGTVTYIFTGPQLAGLTPPAGWTALVPTVWTDTVMLVNGQVTQSAATPALPAGHYLFLATYSGDRNYIGSISRVEPLTIGPVSPMLTTMPSETTVELGPTIPPVLKDTATLSDGVNPTGTITFELFQRGTLVHTETVAVNGNDSYSTPTGFTLPTSGTVASDYVWIASYSGDHNNNPAFTEDDADDEKVSVLDPTPTLVSTANPSMVTLGPNPVTLTETVTLSGGFPPTGDIVFELFRNGDSLPLFVNAVDVHGNGLYSTAVTLPPTALVPGTYQWVAVYGGDPNNNTAVDNDPAAEQVTVVSASPGADLSATKLVNQTNPVFGTPVVYTIIVQNNGPGTAEGVVATDVIPAGIVFVSATPSQGSFDAGSGHWTIGTLLNGATASLQIVGIVAAIGPIPNAASVTSETPDPDPSNNTSTAIVDGMFAPGQISKSMFLSSGDAPPNAATLAAEEALLHAVIPLWVNLWDALLTEAESLLAARSGPGNGGIPVFEGSMFGSPLVVYANPFAGQVTAVQVGTFDFLYENSDVAGIRLV